MSSSRHNKQLSNYLASHKTARNNQSTDSVPAGSPTSSQDAALTDQMRMTRLHDNSKSPIHQAAKSRGKTGSAGRSKPSGAGETKGRKAVGPAKRRATIDDIPDEVLLKLFSHLPADVLVGIGCVCKRWHRLANDNSLWEQLYRSYAATKSELAGRQVQSSKASSRECSWKEQCIQKCIQRRNARMKTLLGKCSPYTHLPANTDKVIQKLGIRLELVLHDDGKREHTFPQSDSFHQATACSVRWYHLQFPPIGTLRRLSVVARAPVFFAKDGSAAANSPCQRSLLLQHDLRWKALSTSHPPDAQDDLIDLRVIGHCILVATWKDGGELAFISVCLHHHGLVHRCTQGIEDRVYPLPSCQPKPDDVDTEYGLHGYSCVLELRNQRSVLWGQQFENIHCSKQHSEERFARLTPIRPDVTTDHSYASKKLQLPWKSDLFKGIVPDFCILDLTLHDEFKKPFWCVSCPVAVTAAGDSVVNYSYDGDPYIIVYRGDKGSVEIHLVWDCGREQYAVTGINIDISLDAINAWFSTHY